jgi:hypothetical protein
MQQLQGDDGEGIRLRHSAWRPSVISKPKKHNPWVVWDRYRNFSSGKRALIYKRKWTEDYKVHVFNRNSSIWKDFGEDCKGAETFFNEAKEKVLFEGKLYKSLGEVVKLFSERYRINKVILTDEQIKRILAKRATVRGIHNETGFGEMSITNFLKKKGIVHIGHRRYGKWIRK